MLYETLVKVSRSLFKGAGPLGTTDLTSAVKIVLLLPRSFEWNITRKKVLVGIVFTSTMGFPPDYRSQSLKFLL